jgi:hypothetical protein
MAEPPAGPSAESTYEEVLVKDPLSPVTRKERLYLLAVSLIGIAMVRTGLVPSKIATFGIELNEPNRNALLFLLALVTGYFLAAFVIYAISDYVARREALKAALERTETGLLWRRAAERTGMSEVGLKREYEALSFQEFAERYPGAGEILYDLAFSRREERRYPQGWGRIGRVLFRVLLRLFRNPTQMMSWPRLFFDFVLPILVGLYAIYALIFRATS